MSEIVSLFGAAWITGVLLLATRIGAMLLLTPVLYAASMPAVARLLIAVALACVLAMPFAGTSLALPRDAGSLITAILREAAIGATLGLGILMAFAGFAVAGRLIDVQIGFGVAQVFDPLTRTRVPVLSSVFSLFAAVFFFLVNGHHVLLRGLAYSIERLPVGQAWPGAGAAEPLVRQMGALFGLGFALAAPLVLGLLLLDFVLGVASRNLPQMNTLVMGMPIKILAGLLALSVWAMGFSAPAARLYAGIHQAWSGWFDAGGRR
ncbi:MAG: putative flagellar biosynthetic protein fliR [Ramlibacter sp.]|nr:putative flagellar biosynthetic protein fliR [Ramlibacter sp.]